MMCWVLVWLKSHQLTGEGLVKLQPDPGGGGLSAPSGNTNPRV